MSLEVIRLCLLVLCWTVLLLRISALRVRQQRLIWFTLLMLGLGLVALQKPVMLEVQRLSGVPRIESLVSSLMAVGVATLLLAFAVRLSGLGPWRRLRLTLVTATLVTMVAGFAIVTSQDVPTRERFLPVPGAFTAHTVYWATYLLYMLGATGVTTVLFWRKVVSMRSSAIRVAVLLLAAATSVFMLFLGSRIVELFVASPEFVTAGVYISSAHSIGIVVGCSLAAVLPLVEAARNWRHCYRLYPLWKVLCEALPNIALQPPRTQLVDLLSFRGSQVRLHRRLIEIRDGLLVMREWVTADAFDEVVAQITGARFGGYQAEAATTACWLKVALRAKRQGLERADEPLDLVRRGGLDVRTELRWLREVADAWRSPVVARCAAAVTAAQPIHPA